MTDLSVREMRKRLRMLEKEVYPGSMSLPTDVPLGDPDDPDDRAEVYAEVLELPQYDDIADAPNSRGRVVFVTGDGPTAKGVYRHDGDSYGSVEVATSSEDIVHDDTQGGTDGNPHADSASDTDLNNHAGEADAHHSKYTDAEASDAAPVQSVNGETGAAFSDAVSTPTYPTEGDVPALDEGDIVYVEGQNAHYFEDGT